MKNAAADTKQAYPDLSTLVFSAKIDFLTVFTPNKLDLPPLSGKVKWPKVHNSTRLTIHDPTPQDIHAVLQAHGPLRLAELEVSVDVRPAASVSDNERHAHLEQVMVGMYARGLDPDHQDLSGQFRGAYCFGKVTPFNLKLPTATAQLLYGHRNDPVQVKAYLKRKDGQTELSTHQHSARVEVALRSDGLAAHGLTTLQSLQGFPFRRKLSGYFRHVKSVERKELGRKSPTHLHRVLVQVQDRDMVQEFDRTGVGCIHVGGKMAGKPVRKRLDIPVNNRIGQALLRLERAHRT